MKSKRKSGAAFPVKPEWSPRPDLSVSQQLKDGGSVGVRPSQILEAAKSSDGCEQIEVGNGLNVILTVKWLDKANYHLVLQIIEQPHKTYVSNAWRLYDARVDISPTAAFARLVESFGTIIQGTQNELFIAKRPPSPTGEVRGIPGKGQNFALNAFMKKTAEGVESSFIFGFETDRYEEYVRRHQR